MKLKFKIEKDPDTPVYRQIIEKITSQVKNGKLSAGDRLPPERTLAEELGIARGTVKKAYEKLAANRIIEMVQGRGSFIASGQDIICEGRKDKAVRIINNALTELEILEFDYREISSLFTVLLSEREEKRESIHVAGIDCNPEALSIFDRQLRHISNVRLFRFLLDDIAKDPSASEKLDEFDLILTTSTHYAEIIGILPGLKTKIIQAAVSPSHQTIIDLAKIPEKARIGTITFSKSFFNIIKGKLNDFQIKPKSLTHIFEKEEEKFPAFIKEIDVLITPPRCFMEERRELASYFQRFTGSGGKVIRFDYQIERGALIHIEGKISELVRKKKR